MEKHLSQLEVAVVRETMMKQQAVYNEQVRELHRVYRVQRALEEGNNSGPLKDLLKIDVSRGPSPSNSLKKEPDKQGSQPKRKFRFDLEKLPDEQSDEDEVEVEEAACTSYCSAEPAGAPRTFGEQRQSQLKQENVSKTPHWLSQVLEKTRSGCWNTRANGQLQQETNRLQNGVLRDFDFFASSKEVPKQERETQVESTYPSWMLIAASNNCEYPVYSPVQGTWPGLQRGFYSSQIHQPSTQQQQQQQHCCSGIHPWQAGASGHFSMAAPSSTFTLNGVLQDGHWLRGNFTLTTPGVEGSFKVSYPGLTDEFQKEAELVYKNGYHGVGDLEKLHKLEGTRKQEADGRSLVTGQSNDAKVGRADGYIMSPEEAASTIIFMASRREACPETELENSVAWFAEAMPTMSPERGSRKQEQEEEVDQFELATLQLKPLQASCCVTSTPAKPSDAVEAGDATPAGTGDKCAARPRRRCKKKMDFQKETLPSISLLTRQEISEDLQIMSGLVRSTTTTRESSGGWEATVAHHHQACQRRKSAKCSPVSTLDVSRSPRRRSSAAAGTAAGKLPCWGSRRERKPRQRRTSLVCFGYIGALAAGNPVSFRTGSKQR